jgi:hypothetical protein
LRDRFGLIARRFEGRFDPERSIEIRSVGL